MDGRFGAAGCFADMFAAMGTPRGLDADATWDHNFQGASGPCWGWVRTQSREPVAGYVDAGPFRLEIEVPPGDGLIVQAFGFASNPAVHVTLAEPGWVDFGRGVVPGAVGLAIVDAVNFAVMGPAAVADPAVASAADLVIKPRFGNAADWFDRLKTTMGQRVEVARSLLTRTLKSSVSNTADLTTLASYQFGDTENADQWSGTQYRRMREARGLTLVDAAKAVTKLAPSLPPTTKDHLYRLESGGRPRVAQFAPRLDMVYRCDGRSCSVSTPVQQVEKGWLADFPDYWYGPVWVEFTPPPLPAATAASRRSRGQMAQIIWRPWQKSIRLSLEQRAVVTCRRATPEAKPLLIKAPPGWNVAAGVGRHAAAIDVNVGWGFVDVQAAKEALSAYVDVLTQAMRGRHGTTD